MGSRVIAIDTGREGQKMCFDTLDAEEFVDFAKGDGVTNIKSVTAGLGTQAIFLVGVSKKPSHQVAEVNLP